MSTFGGIADIAKGMVSTSLKLEARDMTPPPTEPSKQATSAQTRSSNTLKFSKKQLALAFVVAGVSDAIGAFTTTFLFVVRMATRDVCFWG